MLAGLLTDLNINASRVTGVPALAGLSFWAPGGPSQNTAIRADELIE